MITGRWRSFRAVGTLGALIVASCGRIGFESSDQSSGDPDATSTGGATAAAGGGSEHSGGAEVGGSADASGGGSNVGGAGEPSGGWGGAKVGGFGGSSGEPSAGMGGDITAGAGGGEAGSSGQSTAGSGGAAETGGQGGQAGVGGAGGISGGGGTGGVLLPCDLVTDIEGHGYALCANLASWEAARADCELRNMRLVRVDSALENTWVWDTLTALPLWAQQQVWYGASDAAQTGEWRWTDGEVFWSAGAPVGGLYNAWSPGRPNDSSTTKNCLVVKLGTGKEWFDLDCLVPAYYVCEQY